MCARKLDGAVPLPPLARVRVGGNAMKRSGFHPHPNFPLKGEGDGRRSRQQPYPSACGSAASATSGRRSRLQAGERFDKPVTRR